VKNSLAEVQFAIKEMKNQVEFIKDEESNFESKKHRSAFKSMFDEERTTKGGRGGRDRFDRDDDRRVGRSRFDRDDDRKDRYSSRRGRGDSDRYRSRRYDRSDSRSGDRGRGRDSWSRGRDDDHEERHHQKCDPPKIRKYGCKEGFRKLELFDQEWDKQMSKCKTTIKHKTEKCEKP